MADTPPPSAPTVQNTALIGMSGMSSLAVAEWLVQPSWPPPTPVLTIFVGLCMPVLHLVGRGIYRKLAAFFGEPTNGNGNHVNSPVGHL